MLPQIPNIERTREYTQEFRGYNHNLRIAENEFYDELNLSTDNYPVLSTRKKRKRGIEIPAGKQLCGAIGRAADIYYVLADSEGGAGLYKNGNVLDLKSSTGEEMLLTGDGRRQMLFFGAYLLIFPDCRVYNTVNGNMEKYLVPARTNCTLELQYKGQNGTYESADLTLITESELNDQPSVYINKLLACLDANDKNNILWWGTIGIDETSWHSEKTYSIDDFRLKITLAEDSFEDNQLIVNFSELATKPVFTPQKNFGNLERYEQTVYVSGKYLQDYPMIYSKIEISNNNTAICTKGNGETRVLDTVNDIVKISKDFLKVNSFDYITECQNRLWACRSGKNVNGDTVNAIYATELGKFDVWSNYEASASAAYEASVGTPGAFTGVYVVNQNPIFFKEDCIHKVYVSATGAHQIVTQELPGIEEGADKSIVQLNGAVIYKSRDGFVIYDGTSVSSVSSSLGDIRYTNAIAGVSGNKYVVFCKDNQNKSHIFTYDLRLGIWHKETTPESDIVDMTQCDGKLYMISDRIYVHDAVVGDEAAPPFMFETGDIGFSDPDRKYIMRIDLRLSLDFGSRMRIWVQYDSDGRWIETGSLHGMKMVPKVVQLPILPRRCDHFRLKVTGTGMFNLYSITKIMSQGE